MRVAPIPAETDVRAVLQVLRRAARWQSTGLLVLLALSALWVVNAAAQDKTAPKAA